MQIKKVSENRTMYIDDELRIEYKSGLLRFIDSNNDQLIKQISLSTSITDFFGRLSVTERLLRCAPRYIERIGEDIFIVSKSGSLYLLDLRTEQIKKVFTYAEGTNNPLYFCSYIRKGKKEIAFGDYCGHDDAGDIGIYRYSDEITKKIAVIPGDRIDHIHRVEFDIARDCYWILTGDSDEGSGFWQLDYNDNIPKPYLIGKQIYRACAFFLTKSGFIYATDSQLERNHIYNVEYKTKKTDAIADLPGSCIFGLSICNGDESKYYCISTAVETESNVRNWRYYLNNKRGKGILDNYSHLFIGNIESGFHEIWKSKKDYLPMVLFQFGNILFPTQHVNSKIYFCPQACISNGTFEIEL